MKSDKSRETFVPTKHYGSVRLQQGRVLTDADWNEQSDIIEHRNETTSLDVIGPSGAPAADPGFTIFSGSFENGVADLDISGGRMYVDGILCELEQTITYSTQPDPVYDLNLNTPPTIPTGLVLAYLDVWERHIGVIEDPQIREVALGGPDTATRAKTVWQVKTIAIDTAHNATAASTLASLQPTVEQQGKLAARAQPTDAATDPCIIPQAAGFRRLENQLYRVEIHTPGTLVDDPGSNGAFPPPEQAAPTFKWSRENGSVVAAWVDDPHPLPNTLKVQLLTKDPNRGFSVGDWVELTDDRLDLSGFGGTFLQLTQVDGDVLTYSTDSNKIIGFPGLPAATPITRPADSFHPKVRRWDMPPTSSGPQPAFRDSTTDPAGAFIDLEDGVQVQFQAGVYRTGDYWIIPARTATNDIEWPPMTSASDSPPAQLPPFGIQHHLACLATFTLNSGGFVTAPDTSCRKVFSPLTDLNPVTPNNLPQPGEFRYYLVDGTGAAGNDGTGKVGISNISAPAAYSDAIPFATLNAALASFSRDGNDSTAVIMLTPLGSEQGLYDDLILHGLHGYRKVLVRCSAFIDPETNEKIDPLDESDWTVLGATSTGPFSLSGAEASTGNAIRVSTSTPTGGQTDQLVGQRVRFLPDSSLPNFCSMVLGNSVQQPAAGGPPDEIVTLADMLPSIPGGTDQFVLENPSASLGAVEISGAGGEVFFTGHAGQPFSYPSLSLAGLQVENMSLSGPLVAEMAFCRVNQALGAAQASALNLTRFGHVKIAPDFDDETGNRRLVGVGASVDNFIGATDGDQLQLQNCSGFASSVVDVDSVDIQGVFIQSVQLEDCKRFSIGRELQPEAPRLVRMGANLQSGAALRISNSDGDVLGTAFDIANIHLDGKAFDFDANDAVDLSAIQLIGTGRALRIRDVDLTDRPTRGPSAASGVLLDATGAVSSVIDYEQKIGMTVSGLIALPGRSMFRPIELRYTDFRDPADNHYLSPGVSSADVAAGTVTLASFQGRSFVERGISVQGLALIDRFRVVQWVGDGTSRVKAASIAIDTNNPEQSAAAVGASIAGIMQRQIISQEDKKAFSAVLSSGYSLVALAPDSDVSVLPAPLYVASIQFQPGYATTVPPTGGVAVVQIGVLVRVVCNQGLGGNTHDDSLMGLARIHINPNGVPGAIEE